LGLIDIDFDTKKTKKKVVVHEVKESRKRDDKVKSDLTTADQQTDQSGSQQDQTGKKKASDQASQPGNNNQAAKGHEPEPKLKANQQSSAQSEVAGDKQKKEDRGPVITAERTTNAGSMIRRLFFARTRAKLALRRMVAAKGVPIIHQPARRAAMSEEKRGAVPD
jgi:hypothetical protein